MADDTTSPEATSTEPQPNPETSTEERGDAGDETPLTRNQAKKLTGEEGLKADLARERKNRQALEAELEKLRTDALPDNEKLIKEAADAARAEALNEVNGRLFAATLRAETAGKLADPDLLADTEVAVRLLGLGEIPVTSTGDVDAEAISAAVASLLEAKPYLASATPAGPQKPQDLGQGARGTPPEHIELDPKALAERVEKRSW